MLWKGPGWQDPVLGKAFLAQHGIDDQTVNDDTTSFVLMDSGFEGSIATRIDEKVDELYGRQLLRDGKMVVRLACANLGSAAKTIHSDYVLTDSETNFPRTRHNANHNNSIGPLAMRNLFAVALQLLPRYHDLFTDIRWNANGEPEAVFKKGTLADDPDDLSRYTQNGSVVHPLAAAIVQYRVVKSAMDKRYSNHQSMH
jgi:hypothetical protein